MHAGTAISNYSDQQLLPGLIQDALNEGNAITMWRMPRSSEKHLLICTDGVRALDEIVPEDSKTGFVFAPFDATAKKMFFQGNLILTFHNDVIESDQVPEGLLRKALSGGKDGDASKHKFPVATQDTSAPADYLALVEKSIAYIRDGVFEKVVPSRYTEVEVPAVFDVVRAFNKLCANYPDAMVSLVCSEETGTWLGASPELIVSLDDQSNFRTVALAGTKRAEPGTDIKDVAWTGKEIEEQAMVCPYIISCFKKIRVREYEEHGPRTSIAGNLLHLKTDFKVDTKAINFPQLASVMLKLLHPTSAVCGMPLEPASEFLKANEGYDRQYYSGYLGPLNFKNESHVYVNLRCLQLLDKKIRLYAGAGVTIDSNPQKELEETVMKLDTLLSLIK